MKNIRLIKHNHLIENRQAKKTAKPQPATMNQTIKAVKDWVQEYRGTQQQQARQMFAALFTQPQSQE